MVWIPKEPKYKPKPPNPHNTPINTPTKSTNTPTNTPTDLISRQDAIDAFGLSEKTRKYGGDHSGYDTMMLYEIQDVLESLPSADRPTGEWIKSHLLPNGWHCILCDAPVMTDDISEMLFCPNCGTRMYKGGESK